MRLDLTERVTVCPTCGSDELTPQDVYRNGFVMLVDSCRDCGWWDEESTMEEDV